MFSEEIVGLYCVDSVNFGVCWRGDNKTQGEYIKQWFDHVFRHIAVASSQVAQLESRLGALKFSAEPALSWSVAGGTVMLETANALPIFCLVTTDLTDDTLLANTLQDTEITITNYMTSQMKSRLWIHGACLCKDNRLVMLVAPSGFGKTTLSLALLNHGFTLLTDDIIIINCEDEVVLPYPRCPKIRKNAVRLLATVGVNLEEIAELIRQFVILPSRLVQCEPMKIPKTKLTTFFLCQNNAHNRTGSEPVAYSNAIIELAKLSNLLYQEPALETFDRLFSQSEFYRLTIRDLGENIHQIIGIAD